MNFKICPKCLLDELESWILQDDFAGTDDEHIGMIEQGIWMIETGILEGIPSSCLCEMCREERNEQLGLFDEEVRGETAH